MKRLQMRNVILMKISKIKWTDKKSNKEIFMHIEEERTLMDIIIKRKKKWMGHTLRGNSLLAVIIERQIKGSKIRGRPRTDTLDLLKDASGYETVSTR